jgi:hypothetical protein
VDAREELDVGAVRLPRPLADPEQVRGAVVPVAGQRVLAGQPFLVVEQQALVRGEDVDLVQPPLGGEVDPARGHELERALDLGGEQVVAPALGRAGDEVLVPGVHLGQVGVAALRERAQQVERRGGLVVALDHPRRVGHARLGQRGVVVDHVAAEDGQLDAVDRLRRQRARLHELARDPSHLDHRQRRAVREHGGHLQHDLQLLADRHRRVVVERLGAVARLEQERLPRDDAREVVAQPPRLAGEDERRASLQPLDGRVRARRVRPLGLLQRGALPPGGRRPGRGRDCHGFPV